MMRKTVTARVTFFAVATFFACVTVAAVTVAAAADLPSKTSDPEFEPPPPIPVFTWSGFYGGLHTGYGFGRDKAIAGSPTIGAPTFTDNRSGVLGGAHMGVNYALPAIGAQNAVVFGLEGDIDGADDQHTASPLGGVLAGGTIATRSDVKGSLRGRLGLGVNRILLYATGGGALADFDIRTNLMPTVGPGAFESSERIHAGYTLGGGVEYAFMNYLSLRAEYRYTDYDTFDTSAPSLGTNVAHHETDNRLQAGISYKFDPTSAPGGS